MPESKPKKELKAGRALDVRIAQKVFGWVYCKVVNAPLRPTGKGGYKQLTSILVTPENEVGRLPHYSTDIAAAWLVVEKLTEKGRAEISVSGDSYEWRVRLWEGGTPAEGITDAEAETVPLAICLVALKATERNP